MTDTKKLTDEEIDQAFKLGTKLVFRLSSSSDRRKFVALAGKAFREIKELREETRKAGSKMILTEEELRIYETVVSNLHDLFPRGFVVAMSPTGSGRPKISVHPGTVIVMAHCADMDLNSGGAVDQVVLTKAVCLAEGVLK